VLEYCRKLQKELAAQTYDDDKVRAMVDERDIPRADKKWQHVKRGVPILIEIGPRDITGDTLMPKRVADELAAMQTNLFQRALALRTENTRTITKLDEFEAYFTAANADKPEIHGGFAVCHFVEGPQTHAILAKHKVTIRCVPIDTEPGFEKQVPGVCIFTGQPTTTRAVFAKAY